MDFIRENYRVTYAPNTRETVRRQVLHQLVLAGVADYNPFEPGLATNSPRAHYAISEAALDAVKTFGTSEWESAVAEFLSRSDCVDRSLRTTPFKTFDSSAFSRWKTRQALAGRA